MNWISKNVDKVIAFAAAAILLVVAGLMALSAMNYGERKEFQEVKAPLDGTAPQNNQIEPMNVAALERASAALEQPAVWSGHEGEIPVFKSQSYIVKVTDGVEELVKIDPTETLHDPIKTQWILDNDLPIEDFRLKFRDFDQDGFTVLEEYMGDSDPRDPESHPPYWLKLRLKDYTEIPFRIQVSSRSGETIFIETLDVPNSVTQFLRVGDTIEGTDYMIKDLEVKEAPHPELNYPVDVSVVTFENTKTGKQLKTKVQGVADDPDSFVVLMSLVDQKEFKLQLDETFSMPQSPDVEYKVIDMSESKAVIEDTSTQKQLDVLPKDS